MPDTTLQDLVAGLAASRHAGGYRFKVPERVLRQFAGYCRREGYPDGSITREAVDGFLYGRHLRASTIRRNELALRQLAGHAQAAGGELKERSLKDNVKLIEMSPGVQPRSAVGYTIGYLANIIETAGGPKIGTELKALIPELRRYRESIWTRNPKSPAREIAERLYGIVPAIYATGSLSSAAIRWKNQINENSKMIAFNGAIPEMNHNEIVGWSECVQRSKCRPVFLCEDEAPDTVRSMMHESIDILRGSGLDPVTVKIEGRTAFERSLKAVMLGDYVSLFLAVMNGVDPMEVESIKTFKQKLSAILGRKKPPSAKKKNKAGA